MLCTQYITVGTMRSCHFFSLERWGVRLAGTLHFKKFIFVNNSWTLFSFITLLFGFKIFSAKWKLCVENKYNCAFDVVRHLIWSCLRGTTSFDKIHSCFIVYDVRQFCVLNTKFLVAVVLVCGDLNWFVSEGRLHSSVIDYFVYGCYLKFTRV